MAWTAALVQIAPQKADVATNLKRVGEAIRRCSAEGADLVVFPEAVLTGYFLEGGVIEVALGVEELSERLGAEVGRLDAPVDAIVGYYEARGGLVYNSATHFAIVEGVARPVHTHRKYFLPTYGVFDEERFVARGREIRAYDSRFGRMAILICEDVWHSITATVAALKGAETVVVVAASPARGFQQRKPDNLQSYHRILQCTAEEHGVWGLLSMLVGFEGGKGFTGGSLVVDPFGEIVGEGPVGEEHILYARIEPEAVTVARQQAPLLADLAGVLEDILQELQSSGDELCPPR